MSFLAGMIFRPKISAAQDRHPHDPEVIGRYRADFCRRFLSERRRRCASYMKITVPFVIIEGTVCADRRRLDSGNIFHALKQRGPEKVFFLVSFVTLVEQRDLEIDDAVWIETERRVLRVPKTLQS